MANAITASELWADVLSVRTQHPLVHSITNLVVMNFNANVLLAMGAAPVMAHAHEEVANMAAIAQARRQPGAESGRRQRAARMRG